MAAGLILLLGPIHPVCLILAAIPAGILYIIWVDKKSKQLQDKQQGA